MQHPTRTALAPSPARHAFQEVVHQVEGLRQRIKDLKEQQAEARRQYWRQVGPLAEEVVGLRRALCAPLEEALLLPFFSRAEHRQIEEVLLANARSLQERFGEDVADLLRKYSPHRAAPDSDEEDIQPQPAAPKAHERAAEAARARRLSKAERAQLAAEQAARAEQQRLLSNTKAVYRQLARTHHPDLQRDPAAQQQKTLLMQQITEAYDANDLYTLLQLLAASTTPEAPDQATEETLQRYTQALHQQLTELKQQLQALLFGPDQPRATTSKKQEQELRQTKRHLRAEADYLRHILGLMQEPEELREILRELAAAGHEGL